ncbi:MAG: iron chelate uptake ABC transporter family permease subunit [Desulfovibrionales bacterium]
MTGAVLLLASDTVARLVLAPHVLPVAVLTAFLGAPAFLYLLLQKPRV